MIDTVSSVPCPIIERPCDSPYNCLMKVLMLVILTAVAVLACSGEREPLPTELEQIAPGQVAPIVLAPAFGGLTFERPVGLVFPSDDDDRALVVEQPGRILLLTKEDETWSATEFLNITDRVNDRGNEEGLLGLALDPDFESNGLLYVYYTASSPRRSVVSRFTVTAANPDLADAGSESIIIEVAQPYANHNGGPDTLRTGRLAVHRTGRWGQRGRPKRERSECRHSAWIDPEDRRL